MLELSHFLPRDVIEDPYLNEGGTACLPLASYHIFTANVLNKGCIYCADQAPDLFIIAADGQKLATGAPGHSLDTQRPPVGTVGRQQTAIQRIQQNFVLQ